MPSAPLPQLLLLSRTTRFVAYASPVPYHGRYITFWVDNKTASGFARIAKNDIQIVWIALYLSTINPALFSLGRYFFVSSRLQQSGSGNK